jgi:DNA-binding MarR family transcriptional regulator
VSDGATLGLSRVTRLRFARGLRRGPRTLQQLAELLGTTHGGLTTVAGHLEEEKLIRQKRGAQRLYELTALGRKELEKADLRACPPGELRPGSRLLLVLGSSLASVASTVATVASEPSLEWAARLDGRAQLLLAFSPDDTAAVDRLAGALDRIGASVLEVRLTNPLTPDGLTRYLRQVGSDPQLPAA